MPGSARTPRYVLAAQIIRAQIADGTLKPGMPAPSGAALARVTGYSVLTCRKGLGLLVADGTLRAGPSPNARSRVAGSALSGRDVSAARLSGAMAARRRACGLTQAELASAAGFSVTAVGHAETRRYPGDDSGVRDGRRQTALSVSPPVADGLSGAVS